MTMKNKEEKNALYLPLLLLLCYLLSTLYSLLFALTLPLSSALIRLQVNNLNPLSFALDLFSSLLLLFDNLSLELIENQH